MSTSQSQKKEAIAQAAEQELASLVGRGVRIAGNACSPIVLVKGDLDEAERSGGELAAGPDGAALRKALSPEFAPVAASAVSPYDGGDTSAKICTVLARYDFTRPKIFYDGPVPDFDPQRSVLV